MLAEKLGYYGIAAGAAALLLAVVHFWAGPFAPQPSLETVVAESAVEIRDATVRALRGETIDENFARAARNLVGVDVLPSVGANVYDIMRRDTLVLTKGAVDKLVERLK